MKRSSHEYWPIEIHRLFRQRFSSGAFTTLSVSSPGIHGGETGEAEWRRWSLSYFQAVVHRRSKQIASVIIASYFTWLRNYEATLDYCDWISSKKLRNFKKLLRISLVADRLTNVFKEEEKSSDKFQNSSNLKPGVARA